MKKQIIIGITVIACVALCTAMWLQSSEGYGYGQDGVG